MANALMKAQARVQQARQLAVVPRIMQVPFGGRRK